MGDFRRGSTNSIEGVYIEHRPNKKHRTIVDMKIYDLYRAKLAYNGHVELKLALETTRIKNLSLMKNSSQSDVDIFWTLD